MQTQQIRNQAIFESAQKQILQLIEIEVENLYYLAKENLKNKTIIFEGGVSGSENRSTSNSGFASEEYTRSEYYSES